MICLPAKIDHATGKSKKDPFALSFSQNQELNLYSLLKNTKETWNGDPTVGNSQ